MTSSRRDIVIGAAVLTAVSATPSISRCINPYDEEDFTTSNSIIKCVERYYVGSDTFETDSGKWAYWEYDDSEGRVLFQFPDGSWLILPSPAKAILLDSAVRRKQIK